MSIAEVKYVSGITIISLDLPQGSASPALYCDGVKQGGTFKYTQFGWLYYSQNGGIGHPGLSYGSHQYVVDGEAANVTVGNPPSTLEGERFGTWNDLHPEMLLPHLWNAGFRNRDHFVWAMAITEGESGLYTKARNWLPSTKFRETTEYGVKGPAAAWEKNHWKGRQGHSDRGLFQWNSKAHPDIPDSVTDDPAQTCAAVWRKTGGGVNWSPWGHGAGPAFYEKFFDGEGAYPPLYPLVDYFLATQSG